MQSITWVRVTRVTPPWVILGNYFFSFYKDHDLNNNMHKKECNKCNKLFSRQWNLDRHLQDVHEIYDDTKKEKRSREIDDYNYRQRNIDSNNNFWIPSNNSDDINYNQSSYSNNFSNTFPNLGYYHGEHFLFSNFNSQSIEKKD